MAHNSTTTGSVQERIEEMVRRIVSQFNPEKIILFGSHARGEAGPRKQRGRESFLNLVTSLVRRMSASRCGATGPATACAAIRCDRSPRAIDIS